MSYYGCNSSDKELSVSDDPCFLSGCSFSSQRADFLCTKNSANGVMLV